VKSIVIAVWGYTGKTTFAANLAYSLIGKRNDKLVTLLSTNNLHGELQNFFGVEIKENTCLEKALEAEKHPKDFLSIVGASGKLSNLYLLAMHNHVDSFLVNRSYPLERAEKFFSSICSGDYTDYVVIDCCKNVYDPGNALNGVVLAEADIVICLHRPSATSYLWYQSMKSYIDAFFLTPRLVHLLYADDRAFPAAGYFMQLDIMPDFEVPFVSRARHYECEGTPICSDTKSEARRYALAIDKLIPHLNMKGEISLG
jgi:MinD-like ATPase involved in chromosome partitioning or flagellar assembly